MEITRTKIILQDSFNCQANSDFHDHYYMHTTNLHLHLHLIPMYLIVIKWADMNSLVQELFLLR